MQGFFFLRNNLSYASLPADETPEHINTGHINKQMYKRPRAQLSRSRAHQRRAFRLGKQGDIHATYCAADLAVRITVEHYRRETSRSGARRRPSARAAAVKGCGAQAAQRYLAARSSRPARVSRGAVRV